MHHDDDSSNSSSTIEDSEEWEITSAALEEDGWEKAWHHPEEEDLRDLQEEKEQQELLRLEEESQSREEEQVLKDFFKAPTPNSKVQSSLLQSSSDALWEEQLKADLFWGQIIAKQLDEQKEDESAHPTTISSELHGESTYIDYTDED
eukprot:5744176-Ditylum_brightwellii.AAC.1